MRPEAKKPREIIDLCPPPRIPEVIIVNSHEGERQLSLPDVLEEIHGWKRRRDMDLRQRIFQKPAQLKHGRRRSEREKRDIRKDLEQERRRLNESFHTNLCLVTASDPDCPLEIKVDDWSKPVVRRGKKREGMEPDFLRFVSTELPVEKAVETLELPEPELGIVYSVFFWRRRIADQWNSGEIGPDEARQKIDAFNNRMVNLSFGDYKLRSTLTRIAEEFPSP